MLHCLPQRVSRSPQTPNINPYSTYKMALLSVLYILADAQFILAGANTGYEVRLFLSSSFRWMFNRALHLCGLSALLIWKCAHLVKRCVQLEHWHHPQNLVYITPYFSKWSIEIPIPPNIYVLLQPLNGEEGMHCMYTIWHSKFKIGQQDMPKF